MTSCISLLLAQNDRLQAGSEERDTVHLLQETSNFFQRSKRRVLGRQKLNFLDLNGKPPLIIDGAHRNGKPTGKWWSENTYKVHGIQKANAQATLFRFEILKNLVYRQFHCTRCYDRIFGTVLFDLLEYLLLESQILRHALEYQRCASNGVLQFAETVDVSLSSDRERLATNLPAGNELLAEQRFALTKKLEFTMNPSSFRMRLSSFSLRYNLLSNWSLLSCTRTSLPSNAMAPACSRNETFRKFAIVFDGTVFPVFSEKTFENVRNSIGLPAILVPSTPQPITTILTIFNLDLDTSNTPQTLVRLKIKLSGNLVLNSNCSDVRLVD